MNTESLEHYKSLANIFYYPGEDYKSKIDDCSKLLSKEYPKAYEIIKPFLKFISEKHLHEIEEIFGKTFHIQAICYLDIGYVLFAEDYKRGDFLVKMKKEQELANVDCGDELPDNLPNVLTWMSVTENHSFLDEFAVRIMKPTMLKMLQEFDGSRMALKDKVRMKKQRVIIMQDAKNTNVYEYAIQALHEVINCDFPEVKKDDPIITPTPGGNFLKNCSPTGCATSSVINKKVKS